MTAPSSADGVLASTADGQVPAGRAEHDEVIYLEGDLDLVSAPAVRRQLEPALEQTASHLVLDLRDVPFCDAVGLGVLVEAHRRAEATGGRLELRNLQPLVTIVFEVTGLDRELRVADAIAPVDS